MYQQLQTGGGVTLKVLQHFSRFSLSGPFWWMFRFPPFRQLQPLTSINCDFPLSQALIISVYPFLALSRCLFKAPSPFSGPGIDVFRRCLLQGQPVIPTLLQEGGQKSHVFRTMWDPMATFMLLQSLDWFKGKLTGNHGFYHQI